MYHLFAFVKKMIITLFVYNSSTDEKHLVVGSLKMCVWNTTISLFILVLSLICFYPTNKNSFVVSDKNTTERCF